MMEYKIVASFPDKDEYYYEGYQIDISIYVKEYSELEEKLKPIMPPGFKWYVVEIKEMVEDDEDD